MSRGRLALLAFLLASGVVAAPLAQAADPQHTVADVSITSFDGTQIAATVYQPAGADADHPVPLILHSHGWGGSRTSAPDAFRTELDRGFGVLSFDQRGFGETGGRATVQNPEVEGRDVIAVVDYVAGLDWVQRSAPHDPVLLAMGGSYGGGYQLVGALTEVRLAGRTRFDALAPEIAWYDLPESLAPQKVVRTAWTTALYAAGLPAHEDDVHVALAFGAATGQWPDGTVPGVANLQARFHENGPVAFAEKGELLDIPVLIRQGASDNLFNLNQGWKNFERALTADARARSVFIGFNGGHALPNLLPAGSATSGDRCSTEGFGAFRLAFFDAVLAGGNPRDLAHGHAYNLTTAAGDRCVRVESLDADIAVEVGSIVSTTGGGPVQHVDIADGPMTVAGVPMLEATVTSIGVDQRLFFALSVGDSPLTATVVQNNMLPLRELDPQVGVTRRVELPGVAVDVLPGQHLYLTVSPISDMSFGHGSARTPGLVQLDGVVVHLPIAA